MKKAIASVILFSLFVSIGFSQTDSVLRDKKGRIILPQKGDFALGISANPFFRYAGNMFSSSGDNSLNMSLLNSGVIFGKYFLTPKSAIRLKFGINKSNDNYENKVVDDLNSDNYVTDKLERTFTNLNFAIGYEKRRGEGRLQVSYGAEVSLGVYNYKNKCDYGNAFTSVNTNPTTTLSFYTPSSARVSARTTVNSYNNGIGLGLRAFTGIEYFICSKISLGCEMGIGYTQRFEGKSIDNNEYWDYATNTTKTEINESKNSSSNINTDIFNGQIFLLFHF